MGPAILITLGFLFLLEEYFRIRFDDTWPLLLIVMGLLSFAARSASTEGHVQPFGLGGPPLSSTQDGPKQTGTDPQKGTGS